MEHMKMATKTEREAEATVAPGMTQLAKTDSRMKFALVSDADFTIPDALESVLAEGFITQRHLKLSEGKMIRATFEGMEEGELSERMNAQTGEVVKPKVKWIFLRVDANVTVRMLGAYNAVTQLERVPVGSEVVIGRGSDYVLPNGFRCTDYFVLHKPPKVGAGASAATVEIPKTS
jgi:hypothetical protein